MEWNKVVVGNLFYLNWGGQGDLFFASVRINNEIVVLNNINDQMVDVEI